MTLQAFEAMLLSGGEKPISRYFMRYPRTLIGQTNIEPNVLFCEMELADGRRPDFIYIERTSQRQCLHIVEIEDPLKPIFNKMSATFSKQFRQSLYQIEDYLTICQNNTGWLQDLSSAIRRQYRVDLHVNAFMGHLIYGRRREIDTSEEHSNRWGAKAANNLVNIQTYDRLMESHRYFFHSDFIDGLPCVVRNHDGFRSAP